MLKIIREKSNNEDFVELIRLLDTELNSRYGTIQKELDVFNSVTNIETVVIGYKDDKPIGCGCFKALDSNSVEIKRMFVKPDSRGSGIAALILHELENWTIELGFSKSVLETGIKQPDAIRFYSKIGYTKIDNFGQYVGNPTSVCMSKELKNNKVT